MVLTNILLLLKITLYYQFTLCRLRPTLSPSTYKESPCSVIPFHIIYFNSDFGIFPQWPVHSLNYMKSLKHNFSVAAWCVTVCVKINWKVPSLTPLSYTVVAMLTTLFFRNVFWALCLQFNVNGLQLVFDSYHLVLLSSTVLIFVLLKYKKCRGWGYSITLKAKKLHLSKIKK